MVGKLAAGAKPRGRPRKKRKGRPPRPTASAAVRAQQPPATPPLTASRRSLRQRRPRRVEDYADYDDDDDDCYFEVLQVEEEGDEDVVQEDDDDDDAAWKRREKKFKLLQKLPNHSQQHHNPAAVGDKVAEVRNGTGNRGGSAGASSCSSPSEEDDDAERGTKTLRKRKTPGLGGGSGGGDCDVGVELGSDGSGRGNPELEDGRRHAAPRSSETASGRVVHDCPTSTPLPDKKMLQAILDKLQKKDLYGVFAEPVDPEELPDYHKIIEHPMDFGTIRKKLSTGGYANLEQFESDIFLICTNAMVYNAPDTIYFKQARSIQELARKKFQSIRFESDDALKSEQKAQSSSVTKKPGKSFLCKAAQDPAGSHISSAATLTSTGDACTGLDAVQAGPSELPVVEGLMDGSLTCENKSEKGEENSAKSSPIKLGRKPIMLDEDHRTTYNAANEPQDIPSDSVFATFENEQKHLVAVGLDVEYSYARSLARFAATLGPIAWRIASEKIEKALPTGVKFGPGWVGEYEPLPTPVLFFESHSRQQSDHNAHVWPRGANWRGRTKDERKCPQSATTGTVQLCPRVAADSLTVGVMDGKANHLKELAVFSEPLEQRPHLFGFQAGSQRIIPSAASLRHNSLAVTTAKEYNNAKVLTNVSGKTIPQNSPGMMGTVVDIAAQRLEKCAEVTNLGSQELISSSKNNVQPEILKQPEIVTCCPESSSSCVEIRGMPNGKGVESLVGSSRLSHSLGFITTKQVRVGTDCFNQGGNVQAIDDPIELTRLMSGQVRSKVISSNSLVTDNQKQVMPSVSSPRSNSSAAATAAARAWMSVGRSSEHKSTEPSNLIKMQARAASGNLSSEYLVSTSRMLEDDRTRRMPPMSPLPSQAAAEESFVQNNGLTGFPHLIMTQLSRFHGQTPWQGLVPQAQQKQKKDVQPPDLNISFHSPGSPVQQSGVLVDSQQPDLALQL